MTVIAGMSFNGYPVIISDLLITEVGEDEDVIKNDVIPTLENREPHPINSEFSISGMKKKIEIINDKFVISWSGNVFLAISIVRRMKYVFKSKVPSDEDVFNEIGSCEDVSFIWGVLRNDELQIKGYNTSEKEDNNFFEKIIFSGTGYEAVEEADSLFKDKPIIQKNDEIVVDAVCSCLFLFSHLMNHELIFKKNANTIKDRFGGGYDVVCYYNNKFQRINDVTYLYLNSFVDEDNLIRIDGSGTLIKQYSENEILFLRRINFDFIEGFDDKTLATKIETDDCYDLSNMLSTKKSESKLIQDDQLSSSFLCVVVRLPDSEKGDFCFINKYSDSISSAEKSINFICIKKMLVMKFNEDYWKRFEHEMLEFCN